MNNFFEQPCWHCKKFCGGCAWSSKNPQPIEGWIATPTIKRSNGDAPLMQSFAIDYCPEFDSDGTEAPNSFCNSPLNAIKFDGKKFKALMNDLGISNAQMAKEIGYCKETISRFCSGVMIPQPNTKRKMAKAMNLNYEDFIELTRG